MRLSGENGSKDHLHSVGRRGSSDCTAESGTYPEGNLTTMSSGEMLGDQTALA